MKQKHLAYRAERKRRLGLTVFFSGVVFCLFAITMVVIVLVIVVLIHSGILQLDGSIQDLDLLLVGLAVTSILFGTILTTLGSRIPLKPVNAVINAMNRLADGDYHSRLKVSGVFYNNSTVQEFADSFNTMAAELEKTELLRSDFINNFSHEFKTPIVSIAGFAKLLKRGNLQEAEKMEYLDIIEEEALRLSAMATNVLNMTKVENQTILTHVTQYNLAEQIRDSILLLENQWSKKNITLCLELEEHTIWGNEELLKQVWVNLLDNAVKFTEQDGEVSVSMSEQGQWLTVTVSNTGRQIPPESLERIFQKFYQADESHSDAGNGIGLAIVKRVLELHRGYIQVQSEERETQFTAYLPKEENRGL